MFKLLATSTATSLKPFNLVTKTKRGLKTIVRPIKEVEKVVKHRETVRSTEEIIKREIVKSILILIRNSLIGLKF